jgi:hypothetical protein
MLDSGEVDDDDDDALLDDDGVANGVGTILEADLSNSSVQIYSLVLLISSNKISLSVNGS